ncbi:MAG TPA: DUF6776 family protein [Burkholderiales bacterium]|nr:DUF6776 family protein [Burkholderiales bacterium]
MSVRPAIAWYWRILVVMAAALSLVTAIWLVGGAFGAFDGMRGAGPDRAPGQSSADAEAQKAELADLRAQAAKGDRQLQMERAASADLAKQVKALAFENAALKEDLAFFQSLMSSAAAREGGISVNRFRIQPDAVAGEFRYQMLLVQSGQRMKEFQGRLQFVLDVQQDGRKLVMVLPPEGEREGQDYQLNFKFFQRVEGTFKLSPGSVLKGMQVRVFENGGRAPKLTQSLSVS